MVKRVILEWLPDYDISEFGEIRRITPSKTRGKIPYVVKGNFSNGYHRVKLMLPDGSKKIIRTHRIVCEAFHGKPPFANYHAAHFDGNPSNNSKDNLRWATAKQNVGEDKARHGRVAKGEKNGRCKVTQSDVIEMRSKYNGEHGQIAEIARQYGLSYSATSSILKGDNWSWL